MPSAAARSAHSAARQRSSGNSSVRPTIERPIVWSTPPANSGSSGNTSRFRNQPATTRRAPRRTYFLQIQEPARGDEAGAAPDVLPRDRHVALAAREGRGEIGERQAEA